MPPGERFMLQRLSVFIVALLLAGCVGQPTCYVTLGPGGEPTAEACQVDNRLVVRPITPRDDAFFTPPYVLAALMAEGFVSGPAAREAAARAAEAEWTPLILK